MSVYSITAAALDALDPIPNAMGVMLGSGGEFPEEYIVYTQIAGVSRQNADNREQERAYTIQVSYYSRNGLAEMPDIDGAMLAAGFQKGPERELPFNETTLHHGIAKDYTILLNQN